MNGIKRTFYDVVVVGLGPVGTSLATLLGQAGLSVLAVDKSLDLYPLPRAAAFDAEIMRIFQRMGVADAVKPFTRFSGKYAFVDGGMNTLLEFDRTTEAWTSGWPPGVTFHQPSAEREVRNAMARIDSVDFSLGTSFESYDEIDESVHVTLQGENGHVQVEAKYLIGCDGGSSPVRKFADIRLESMDFEEPWVVVDFLSDDQSGLPDLNLQVCDPDRPATYMQMGPGRYRWEFMILPQDDESAIQQDETIYEMLRACKVTRRDKIERSAVYRFHGLVAKQWRKGRLILAGDAAHQTPPFAGQGMCSGLRDAMNLAWKLAAVLTGQADMALLDSYQTERDPLVRFIINSSIEMGKVVCMTDRKQVAERNRRMREEHQIGEQKISMTYPPIADGVVLNGSPGAGALFIQPFAQTEDGELRLDDVLGARPCILTRQDFGVEDYGIATLSLSSQQLRPFAPVLTDWFDAHDAEAVLIRPDLYVFGTGTPDVLARSYSEMLQPQVAEIMEKS